MINSGSIDIVLYRACLCCVLIFWFSSVQNACCSVFKATHWLVAYVITISHLLSPADIQVQAENCESRFTYLIWHDICWFSASLLISVSWLLIPLHSVYNWGHIGTYFCAVIFGSVVHYFGMISNADGHILNVSAYFGNKPHCMALPITVSNLHIFLFV